MKVNYSTPCPLGEVSLDGYCVLVARGMGVSVIHFVLTQFFCTQDLQLSIITNRRLSVVVQRHLEQLTATKVSEKCLAFISSLGIVYFVRVNSSMCVGTVRIRKWPL
jgi:hypothetical protein